MEEVRIVVVYLGTHICRHLAFRIIKFDMKNQATKQLHKLQAASKWLLAISSQCRGSA
jgi:hypothetical protein